MGIGQCCGFFSDLTVDFYPLAQVVVNRDSGADYCPDQARLRDKFKNVKTHSFTVKNAFAAREFPLLFSLLYQEN